MGTVIDAITDEEFVGYLTAMLRNEPYGQPATSLEELDIRSGSLRQSGPDS